jgi:hypothetical protein
MNTQPAIPMPFMPPPKVNGQGVVYKKDGSISKPEPERKENGRNPDDRSA